MSESNNFYFWAFLVAVSVIGSTFYFATIGFGLPTQNDPISIRQESENTSRTHSGGTRFFGK